MSFLDSIRAAQQKKFEKQYGTGAVRAADKKSGTNYALAGYETVGRPGQGYRKPVYVPINQQAPAPAAEPAPAPAPKQQQQAQTYKAKPLKVSAQEPVEKGPTAADLAVERLTEQMQAREASFQASLQQQAQLFAEQAIAQEQRMSDLQQQMIQSTVMASERPKTVGVKAATGAAGTQMAIARRGATGAFGRGGMRISSLNV